MKIVVYEGVVSEPYSLYETIDKKAQQLYTGWAVLLFGTLSVGQPRVPTSKYR